MGEEEDQEARKYELVKSLRVQLSSAREVERDELYAHIIYVLQHRPQRTLTTTGLWAESMEDVIEQLNLEEVARRSQCVPHPGMMVVVQRLRSLEAQKYNGETGILVKYEEDTQRWQIRLYGDHMIWATADKFSVGTDLAATRVLPVKPWQPPQPQTGQLRGKLQSGRLTHR